MGNSYSIKIASLTNYINDVSKETGIWWGSTETWTRIVGFRVQSANHYTIEP